MLKGKVSIVTGGGSGIGRTISLKFSEQGAWIIVADIHLESALDTVSQIEKMGGRALAVKTDVSDKSQVVEMKERTLKEWGKIDVLVNDAAVMSPPCPIEELPEQDWDRVMAVNVRGVFLCSQIIGKEMIHRKQGSIINIASISGHGPYPFGGAYSSSKGAVLLLTQQLALEWGKHNVRVNSISPGMVRTPLNERVFSVKEIYEGRKNLVPLGRVGSPADIADTAVFLACDKASFITGADVMVDGGFMVSLQGHIPGKAGNK